MPPKTFEEIEELTRELQRQGNEYMRALADRAEKQKNPLTAIYTAEGKLLIRETRTGIRDAVSKYRKNPPVGYPKKGDPDYPGSFAEKLELAIDKLEKADRELEDYVTEKTPSSKEAFKWYREERRSYQNAQESLKEALNLFDECFLFEESDTDDNFRRMYAQTANLHGLLSASERGNLQFPDPATRTENGKRIHFVDTTKNAHQPMADIWDPVSGTLRRPKDYDESDAHYYDRRKDPLFTHDPCPEDLCQGCLGNCYMLSMLSSIAAQDPQFIKDAMCDNGDNVTVRFFNGSGEPVYVTVDKSVPGLRTENGYYNQIYARGPLWVQLMEKAYAASGIKNGRLKDAERGIYLGDHQDIARGYALDFVSSFMGDAYRPAVNEDIRIPPPNNEPGLTDEEYNFIVMVRQARNNGAILYAGTRFRSDNPAIQSEKTKGGEDFTGIYSQHAHSLHGIVEDNGRYYVKVRNPHGQMGRIYKNGSPEIDKDARGYNLVDIKVFGRYFDMVQAANVPVGTGDRLREKEVSDLRAMYGDAVNIIEKTLRKSDAFYLKFRNSPAFRDMREASVRLKEEFSSRVPHPNGVKREFNKLFEAAHRYLEYRDAQTREFADESTDRAVNRYQMAEAIVSLETLYKDNPTMRREDFKELEKTFGESGDHPSAAKLASMQVHNRRMAARTAAQAPKESPEKKNAAPVNGERTIKI